MVTLAVARQGHGYNPANRRKADQQMQPSRGQVVGVLGAVALLAALVVPLSFTARPQRPGRPGKR
jgi:hypothetical protein